MSIFQKNFLTIFLLLVVSTAITCVFWVYERSIARDQVQHESIKAFEADYLALYRQRGVHLATILEKTLAGPLAQGDYHHVENSARLVLKQPSVNLLIVFDKQKKILFSSENPALPPQTTPSQLLPRGFPHGKSLARWREENSLHFLNSIYHDDNLVGGFYFELSLADFNQSLKSIQSRLQGIKAEQPAFSQGEFARIGFFLLLLGVWLAYRAARHISRPIHSLAQMVRNLREGNHNIDIPAHRNNEVGRLMLELEALAKDLKNTNVSTQYLETVFSSMQEPLAVVSREGRIHAGNYLFACLVGTDEESLVGEKIWDYLEIKEEGQKHCLGQGKAVTGMACHLKVGSRSELMVSVLKIPEAGKADGNYVFVLRDISKQKWLAEMILYNANHDSLTGLANRPSFLRKLEKALKPAQDGKRTPVAVLFIGLDRFKHINDSFGHRFGDAVLRAFSERLRSLARNGDTVSRLGGDEFIVLLGNLESESEAWRIALQLHQKLTRPFSVEGREIILECSIGITCGGQDFEDPSQILGNADLAMHEAKKRSSEKVVLYSEGMRSQTKALFFLESDLRAAIKNKAIEIYFQPIVTIADKDFRGFEVLARWDHPQHGMIPPSFFIPMAERVGLIERLEWTIFEKVFVKRQEWRRKFPDMPFYLAVNVSGYQLGQISFPVYVGRSFQKYGIRPGEIVFEATESMLMRNPAVAGRVLCELKKSGAKLALDDFGTGYSSLSHLSRFPFDFLKIDQSFVRGACKNPEGHHGKIVETIARLGHNLGMEVIAEGVETDQDLQRVKVFRVDAWQGFLSTPPTDAQHAEIILQEARLNNEERYFALSG